LPSEQGTVDKVVVVIKDNEQVPLERFIFSLESMIEVEAFNKDTGYGPFLSA
jgi:mitotic spindle assembly checkpoint protein MAD2B